MTGPSPNSGNRRSVAAAINSSPQLAGMTLTKPASDARVRELNRGRGQRREPHPYREATTGHGVRYSLAFAEVEASRRVGHVTSAFLMNGHMGQAARGWQALRILQSVC